MYNITIKAVSASRKRAKKRISFKYIKNSFMNLSLIVLRFSSTKRVSAEYYIRV